MSSGNKTLSANNFPVVDQLTPSESRVYELYQQGKTHAEIGEALGMKPKSAARRVVAAKAKIYLR